MERLKEFLVKFKNFSQVKAIAIGGSGTAKTSDILSDIDIYIFIDKDIPVIERENLIKQYSSKYEVGGKVVFEGSVKDICNCETSKTGMYLKKYYEK